MIVSLRADVFLVGFGNLPVQGGAVEIFNFSLNCLHFYLVTHVQYLLFCAADIGGGVEPGRRVAGIASRAIRTRTVAGIARWGAVAVSRLRSSFYVSNL